MKSGINVYEFIMIKHIKSQYILKVKSNFTLFMYIPFRGICE